MHIKAYYRPGVGREKAKKAIEHMLHLAWPLRLYEYRLQKLSLQPNHLLGYEYEVGKYPRKDLWDSISQLVEREAIFLLDSRFFSSDELGMYRPCIGMTKLLSAQPPKIAYIVSSYGIQSAERIAKLILHEVVESHLVAQSGQNPEHCTHSKCILFSPPYPYSELYPTKDEEFFNYARKIIDGWKGLCEKHKSAFEKLFFDT